MTTANYIHISEWIVRLVMGTIIVLRKRSPAASLSWLVVVAFLPLFGAVFYLLIGENRLGRRRSRKHHAAALRVRPVLQSREKLREVYQPQLGEELRSVAHVAEAHGAGPPLGGNALSLLSSTDEFIRRLTADIDSAERHCHLLFYIFNGDDGGRTVAGALCAAARRGVACRLLVDAVGSRDFLRGPLAAELHAAGVEVAAALPVSLLRAAAARVDLRNHRKLAVFDGRVAYTGSHNVSLPIYPRKARYGAWVDATVRLEGPSVHDLQEVFLEDWSFATEAIPANDRLMPLIEGAPAANVPIQVLPTGPENRESPLADVLLQALRTARERVVLTTPYFVPDEVFVATLRSAAARGVQVSIVVPKHSDHAIAQAAGRSQYGYLLEAGVKVFEYKAGLLHSKTLTVDGRLSVIGSANLDVRSFLLNFELCLLVYDADFSGQLHFLQASYIDASEPLTIASWRARGKGRVLWDNTAKLLGPLL